MTVSISDIRTVPVGEDLTKEDLRLQVLRGLETMHRVDKKVASGVGLLSGEWAVLNDSGELERPGASAVANTYLVFSGTDRWDAKATGKATLIMSSPIIVKTSQFDTGATYHAGDYLTVKSLGVGAAYVTKQSSTEPKLAKVVEVGDGYLVFEVLSI